MTEATHERTTSFASGRRSIEVEQFGPVGGGRHPAVLFLHGMDGLQCRGDDYRRTCRALAVNGYIALLPHYYDRTGSRPGNIFLNPLHFIAWMDTVRDGLTYAGGLAGADPERLGLIGVSLGAYLALAVAAQDERVRAVVELFGGLPEFFRPFLRRLPPVLILHGEADPVVSVEEARRLERFLRETGQVYEARIYPGQGHGFHGPARKDAEERARTFLDRYLKGGAQSSYTARIA